MISPETIIFAIEAGVKLGQKINQVLIEQTVSRPLILPLGTLFADRASLEATDYFQAHPELTAEGGPYANATAEVRLEAYQTLLAINERLGNPGTVDQGEAQAIIQGLHAYRQETAAFAPKSPARQIIGTVVELGIDYFVANPEALGADSNARKIVHAFLKSLDETDFATGSVADIVRDVLGGALRTLGDNVGLIDDDKRLQVLLGGITKSLAADLENAASTDKLGRKQFVARFATSILRGGIGAFTENIDLFVGKEAKVRGVVQSTLTQVMAGIRDQENLFTPQTFELVVKSALNAAAENADLFTQNDLLKELISRTLKSLAAVKGLNVFTEETFAAVLRQALEVVGENVETLIQADNPQKHLLANAVGAMARSLAASLAGSGKVREMLSTRQLLELSRSVFDEVAKHPEQLLGGDLTDEKKTVLAQVIGSVARALGENPKRLVNGAGFVELVRIALQVAVKNSDKLIDLEKASPSTNALFQVLNQVVTAILEQKDPRQILTREVFVELVRRVLPVASANLDAALADHRPVAGAVEQALELASGALNSRINGANLPLLVEQMLRAVLWDELNLGEALAVRRLAVSVLKKA